LTVEYWIVSFAKHSPPKISTPTLCRVPCPMALRIPGAIGTRPYPHQPFQNEKAILSASDPRVAWRL
jgi:hypothetical protein